MMQVAARSGKRSVKTHLQDMNGGRVNRAYQPFSAWGWSVSVLIGEGLFYKTESGGIHSCWYIKTKERLVFCASQYFLG